MLVGRDAKRVILETGVQKKDYWGVNAQHERSIRQSFELSCTWMCTKGPQILFLERYSTTSSGRQTILDLRMLSNFHRGQ